MDERTNKLVEAINGVLIAGDEDSGRNLAKAVHDYFNPVPSAKETAEMVKGLSKRQANVLKICVVVTLKFLTRRAIMLKQNFADRWLEVSDLRCRGSMLFGLDNEGWIDETYEKLAGVPFKYWEETWLLSKDLDRRVLQEADQMWIIGFIHDTVDMHSTIKQTFVKDMVIGVFEPEGVKFEGNYAFPFI